MSTILKYRIACTTDSKDEFWFLDESAAVPTTCPTDTAHTIDGSKTVVVKRLSDIPTVTDDGKTIVTAFPVEGASRTTFITHDFCDKTTWYASSVRVVDEVATNDDPGTYTAYSVANTPVVDAYHGKIFREEEITDDADNSYTLVVKVNDVAQTEQDPHTGSGGDFTFNYDTGVATFLTALIVSDEVKITYHKVMGSVWTVKPVAGKRLLVTASEVQFANDMVMNDTVVYQPYGWVDAFAPELLDTADPAGPYPSGTLIPLGDPVKYKSVRDFVGESNGALPSLPAMGGGGWRGLGAAVTVLPWDYNSVTDLKSSCGMEIRVSLEHDMVFDGTYGTATMYCLSVDE